MHKTITGLLGAVATLGVAQAAPTPDPNDALKANSFAELLEPIPNATAVLNAMDEKPAPKITSRSLSFITITTTIIITVTGGVIATITIITTITGGNGPDEKQDLSRSCFFAFR